MIVLVVLGVGMSLPAQELLAKEDKEAPAANAEGKKKPRLICRRETTAGSHLPRRICRTERDLEIERQEAERIRDSDNVLRELPTDG